MPGPIVYVPSKVGEGYFTDWQAPVAGDNGKTWIYNHGTGKFEPYTIPTVAPGGSSGYIQYNNSGAFGASGVYWDSVNSRVGIGTASPTAKLHLFGSAPQFRLDVSASGDSQIIFTENGTDKWQINRVSSDNSIRLVETGVASRINVLPGGNVGIGTTSPSQKLDVNGSVNVATALIVPVVRPASDSTTALKVTKADGTTAVVTVDTTNSLVKIATIQTALSGELQLVNHGLGVFARFINNTGALILGTTDSYSERLVVAGDVRLLTGYKLCLSNTTDNNSFYRDSGTGDTSLKTPTVFQFQHSSSGLIGKIATDGIYVGSTKIIGARGSAVSDATGGSVIDVEARAAINALLARVRAHGLIA